ncbi:unnamed protein product [Ostreobium quekettii]|uniref:Tr-type G domain-containing protein n=1 Tax=Ostreobium quekettii TaxID=121088 RepID=A0A8S1JEM4_9CHLO|nr:unnamed protein product [Ostreobium quekettii]|eukprot:evm.model.scf_704.1 EVM.evm.TU.scf_704.1   scf_704:18771-31537(+)
MLDDDLGNLDLGSRRKPRKWVAVAPASTPASEKRKQRGSHKSQGASSQAGVDGALPSPKPDGRDDDDEGRDPTVSGLGPEDEEGCVEYKLRIKDPNAVRFQQLVTQMKYRLSEGEGQCTYYIGVEDDGYPRGLEADDLNASLAVAKRMAESLSATATVRQWCKGASGLHYAILDVQQNCSEDVTGLDIRIAVAGGADSGKSTLVAVMTHGTDGKPILDNGGGSARTTVLRHKHEIETGRTSSISQHMLGYDQDGRVLNYVGVSTLTPAEIGVAATRQINFVDIGGLEKYLKTALYGMTSMLLDYMLLCVSAASGPQRVMREHLAVALALDIPVAVVITKVDAVDAAQAQRVLDDVRQIVEVADKALGARLGEEGPGEACTPCICSEEEAEHWSKELTHQNQRMRSGSYSVPVSIPIFMVSSVTGAGLQLLHTLLSGLQPSTLQRSSDPSSTPAQAEGGSAGRSAGDCGVGCRFQVDQTFDVADVGLVVSGTAVDGTITLGQRLNLGPDADGNFVPVSVSCIQRSQIPVKAVRAGQTATLALSTGGPAGPDLGAAMMDRIRVSRSETDSGDPLETGRTRGDKTDGERTNWTDSAGRTRRDETDGRQTGGTDEAGRTGQDETDGQQTDWTNSADGADGTDRTGQDKAREEGLGRQDASRLGDDTVTQWGQPGDNRPGAPCDAQDLPDGWEGREHWSRSRTPPSPTAPPVKGAVLLGASLGTTTAREFDATVVLLGGHWPPRGLLSGRWPPVDEAADSESDSQSGGSYADLRCGRVDVGRSRSRHRHKTPLYLPVIHAGSIRQAAQVVSMEEHDQEGSRSSLDWVPAPFAAATAVATYPGAAGGDDASDDGELPWCVARVRFRFAHRSEWLQEGVRFIARDTGKGHLSGVGVVRELHFDGDYLTRDGANSMQAGVDT